MQKGINKFNIFMSVLLMFLVTFNSIQIDNVEAATWHGGSAPPTLGSGTSGNWGIAPSGTFAMRLLFLPQDYGTFAKEGFQDKYPMNKFGITLILGSGTAPAQTRVPNLYKYGRGWIDASNIHFEHIPLDGSGSLEDTRNGLYDIFYDMLNIGNGYDGNAQKYFESPKEINRNDYVTKEGVDFLNPTGNPIPWDKIDAIGTTIKLTSKPGESIEERNKIAQAMMLLAAYYNSCIPNENKVDLSDVYYYYMSDRACKGDKEYILAVDNLYGFKLGSSEYFYTTLLDAFSAVAGKEIKGVHYQGDFGQFISNVLGFKSLGGSGELLAQKTYNDNNSRRGGHTSTLNLMFDYMYNTNANLAGNGMGRYIAYWREKKINEETKEDIWKEQFKPVTNWPAINTAKVGFMVLTEIIPTGGTPQAPEAIGKHQLYSDPVEKTVPIGAYVEAEQYIDFTQEPDAMKQMVDKIYSDLANTKEFNTPLSSDDAEKTYLPSDKNPTVKVTNIEVTSYEKLPSEVEPNFNINPGVLMIEINKEVESRKREYKKWVTKSETEIKQQIRTIILDSFKLEHHSMSVTSKTFDSDNPSSHAWNYASKAQLNYKILTSSNTEGAISLGDSSANTVIKISPTRMQILRWQNQPVGFAEVKQGEYSENRSKESWEAMDGTPTTETLYINAGGTPVYVDIVGSYTTTKVTRHYWGSENLECPGHSNDDGTWYCGGDYDEATLDKDWVLSYMNIDSVTVSKVKGAVLNNVEIFVEGKQELPLIGEVKVEANPVKRYASEFGSNRDSYSYGFSDGNKNPTKSITNSGHSGASGMKAINEKIAEEKAAGIVAFAQSDQVTLIIDGVSYEVMHHNIEQKDVTTGGKVDCGSGQWKPTNAATADIVWDKTCHIKPIGYLGRPKEAQRNNGRRFYKAGITPLLYQTNGMYKFKPEDQTMEYDTPVALVGHINYSFPDEYPVLLEYTDYKMTCKGVEDGVNHHLDADTKYKGPNPIVFHDPVSAQNVWIHDIPASVLKDQRIKKGGEFEQKIETHDNVTNANAPSRQYIDFDFKITFGNSGSFGKDYAGTQAVNEKGVLNVNETAPGTRAGGSDWGFYGDFNTKLSSLPRSAPLPTLPNTGRDTSKWINAKYVRFNGANVRYSKDGLYYPSGTWIKLYDDGFVPKTGDTTEFIFRITSDVKDAANVTYDYLSEAVNIPEAIKKLTDVQSRANALYADSESKPVNSARGDFGYASINGNITTVSARHSAKNMSHSDVIGRIGNVIVDDSNDPAWTSTFWKPGSAWLIEKIMKYPDTETPVSKYFSIPYGLFEEKDTSRESFNNRWGGLSQFHNSSNIRLGSLPVMRGSNVETFYKHTTIKMGYNIQFSVQTLGNYDSQMSVVPSYELGDGFPNAPNGFSFYAPSPDEKGNVFMKQFYNSKTTNPYKYEPDYRYPLSHTLKSSRAKINEYEKSTPEYKSATKTNSVKLGTPSLITIPKALRTYIGSQYTTGNVSILGEGGNRLGSENIFATYTNAQRWHGRIGLPSNTTVCLNSSSNSALEKLNPVKKTHAQYIKVYLTFRTQGSPSPWDLTTRTNSPSNPSTDSQGNPEYPFVIPPGPNNNPPTEDVPKDTKDDPYKKPRVPVVVLDYSFDSSTDSSVVGTH